MADEIIQRILAGSEPDRVALDVGADITEIEPRDYPLTVLLRRLRGRRRVTTELEFFHFERDVLPRTDTVTQDATASDTTLHVAIGGIWQKYDVIKVPRTGENMLVTNVTINPDGTGVLTVVRGWGSTSPAAINQNELIDQLGSATPEVSGARVTPVTRAKRVYNNVQIFRRGVRVSKIAQAIEYLAGEKPRDDARARKAREHQLEMEASFWFGEAYIDTTTDETPILATRGVMSFLRGYTRDGIPYEGTPHVLDVSGSGILNFYDFIELTAELSRHGAHTKVIFASPNFLSIAAKWAQLYQNVFRTQSDTIFGIRIERVFTPHFPSGLPIVPVWMFSDFGYDKLAVILDMSQLRYRPLQGWDTKFFPDVGARDVTEWLDEYITVAGLEFRYPRAHAIIEGFTDAS